MQQALSDRLTNLEKEVNVLTILQNSWQDKKECSVEIPSLMSFQCIQGPTQYGEQSRPQTANSRNHRLRSKSRTLFNKNVRPETIKIYDESPTRMMVEGPKRYNNDYDKSLIDSFHEQKEIHSHPEGQQKTQDLKRKLYEEIQKAEEAYKIIENLKEELSFSKARMSTMGKDLQIMLGALNSLRNKYKGIKAFRKEALMQIDELKKVNTDLCKKLEQEMKKQFDIVKQTEENSTSQLRKEASKIIMQTKEQYEKLQDAHEKLKNVSQELHKKFVEATREIEILKIDLHKQINELHRKKKEMDELNVKLEKEREKNITLHNAVRQLEVKLKEMSEKEALAHAEIKDLRLKINTLEENREMFNQKYCQREQEYTIIKGECEQLKQQLTDLNCKDAARCIRLEKELDDLRAHMNEKESKILAEKTILSNLVGELSDVVRSHKIRIKELLVINKQQETMLKNQAIILRNKEQEVQKAEEHAEESKNKVTRLEEQVGILRQTLKNIEAIKTINNCNGCNYEKKVVELQDELIKTRKILGEEKHHLRIKEKIICDQADTIKKLKNSMNHKNQGETDQNLIINRLQQRLQNEVIEKQRLLKNIAEIKRTKDKLKDEIQMLENALRNNKNNNIINPQEKLLASLEQQVVLKEKEWDLRCKLLATEKRRAVQAAKYATQKLVDTVSEYQSQQIMQQEFENAINKIDKSSIIQSQDNKGDMKKEKKHVRFSRFNYPEEKSIF